MQWCFCDDIIAMILLRWYYCDDITAMILLRCYPCDGLTFPPLALFSDLLLTLNARHDLVQLFIFWQFNALHLFLIVQDLCDHILAGLQLWLDRMNDNSQWKNNVEKYSGRQITSKIIQSHIQTCFMTTIFDF